MDSPQLGDWTPSDAGPWRTLTDEDDGCVHIMPLYGPPHVFYPVCWCHPVCAPDEMTVILHNVAQ